VRRAIANDDLRAMKFNSLVRIDPRDLEDFIRDHRNQ